MTVKIDMKSMKSQDSGPDSNRNEYNGICVAFKSGA